MALSRVQTTPKNNSAGTTLTLTFSAPPTIGNAIVVCVASSSAGPISCTDNRGNTYQEAIQFASPRFLTIYYCNNITTTGTPFIITITVAATFRALTGAAIEVGGTGGNFFIDRIITNSATSTSISTNPTIALQTTGDTFIVAGFVINLAQASITVESVSPVWTEIYEQLTISDTTVSEFDSRIITSAGGTLQSASWIVSSSGAWGAAIVAFKTDTTTIIPTRFYLTANTPVYTPSTLRGAWDDTTGSITRSLDTTKVSGGAITTIGQAEINASSTWDVLLYRGISGPLAAQTILGSINLIIGVDVTAADADMCWHAHIYVTQGNTDTPRGTLLTDYVELIANEWPTIEVGKAFATNQALSSVTILAGDRIVVELGYIARNVLTASKTGIIYYGTTVSGSIASDMTVGGSVINLAGFIEFSSTITEIAPDIRTTQDVIETLSLPTPDQRVTQLSIETLSSNFATAEMRVTQDVIELLTANPVVVTSTETTQFYIVMP